jgi:subtilisin family serine protease
MSGTSMACPHVSGVAALAIAAHPGYTNQQIRELLWNTAEDIGAPGWDIYFGYGLVDAQAAVI